MFLKMFHIHISEEVINIRDTKSYTINIWHTKSYTYAQPSEISKKSYMHIVLMENCKASHTGISLYIL